MLPKTSQKFALGDGKREIFCVRFAPDDLYLAACGNGFIHVYNTSTSQLAFKLLGGRLQRPFVQVAASVCSGVHYRIVEPENQLFCLDFLYDGTQFATAGKQRHIRIYDESTKKLVQLMRGGNDSETAGPSNRVFSLKYHPLTRHEIVSGGWDSSVQIWDVRQGRAVRAIAGPHICGEALDISQDLGPRMRIHDQLQLWDLRSLSWAVPERDVWGLTVLTELLFDKLSEDDDEYKVTVRSAAGCSDMERSWQNLFEKVEDESSGMVAAGGSGDHEVKVFQRMGSEAASAEAEPFGKISSFTQACYSVDFANAGDMLAAAGGDGVIQTHIRLAGTADRKALVTSSYMDLMYKRLVQPLQRAEIQSVVSLLDAYGLRKEHMLEHLTELRQPLGCQDLFKQVDAKVKAALTRELNSGRHAVRERRRRGVSLLSTLGAAAVTVFVGLCCSSLTDVDLSELEAYGEHTLVLLRHGESEWNLQNRFTGWVDVDVSAKGAEEATNAGKLLHAANVSVDEMDCLWIPVVKTWKLNERMYGDLQGLNKAETAKKFGEEQVTRWRRSFSEPPPPIKDDSPYHPKLDPKYRDIPKKNLPLAESLALTIQRVLPFWRQSIAPQLHKGKKVLIAAHGNSLRALVKYLDNDKVVGLNIPTGVPLVYRLNRQLKPVELPGHAEGLSGVYLGDPDWVSSKINGVKNQAKGR
eukprot:s3244_g4.t1